jgi:hypothetical protein
MGLKTKTIDRKGDQKKAIISCKNKQKSNKMSGPTRLNAHPFLNELSIYSPHFCLDTGMRKKSEIKRKKVLNFIKKSLFLFFVWANPKRYSVYN